MTILDRDFGPGSDNRGFSSWRHGPISIFCNISGRRLNFFDKWCPFDLDLGLIFFIEHNFAEAYPLDKVLGDIADFFPITRVIKEESIGFCGIKFVDFLKGGVGNRLVILFYFDGVELSVVDVLHLHKSWGH